jgi:hypothetical protein
LTPNISVRQNVTKRRRLFSRDVFLLFAIALGGSGGALSQSVGPGAISVSTVGANGHALPGVKVEGSSPTGVVCSATTDGTGHGTLECGDTRPLHVAARLAGYLTAEMDIDAKQQSSLAISLTPAPSVQQSVTVQSTATAPLTESSSSETKMAVEEAKNGPLRPNTLIDALPLMPGVIRTPDGRVQISGLDEGHSSLVVNSVIVNNPATGDFGLSIPVDSVDLLKVMQSPYLAQYGSFEAGVVSAETRRGGTKWDYNLNDPLPDFRIRSGHLEGLRDAAPRLNLSGPLLRNRLYIVEGLEYLIDNAEVRTLPFPVNETRSKAINSFTQGDALLGSRNTVTATLHFAPHSIEFANLNYFDPIPVTPNAAYHEDTGTITHRFAVDGGLISSTFAGTRVATRVNGQAQSTMVLSPVGDSGSYFNQQSREATRFQWLETWSPAVSHWHGEHVLQLGSIVAHAEDQGAVSNRDVQIVNGAGQLLRTISFTGGSFFDLADLEPAVYAQDHWILGEHVAIDAGARFEDQSLTHTSRVAPRLGLAWSPAKDGSTIVRGGIGVFFDSIPLDTYAFGNYPRQTITTYDGNGNITDGPRQYVNVISQAPLSGFPLVHEQKQSGNFAPYNLAWNVEGEHVVTRFLTFRLHYLHADGHDQLTLTPEVSASQSAMVLADSGTLESHQLEVTSRIGPDKEHQFFFSYVRQFAVGDITEASSYLGDFPFPVVRSQIVAHTAGEIPNRLLFWGTSALPWRIHLSPRIEYRNGFTWQPVDQLQNYIDLGSAAQPRYPRYFTADLRAAKDFNIGPKHAVRFSLTFRNLTNHDNPLQVHSNSGDPLYGTFFGNYGRHELFDFDYLF